MAESSLRQEDAAVAEPAHVQPPRTDKKTEGSSSRQEIAAVAEPAHVQPPRTDDIIEGTSSDFFGSSRGFVMGMSSKRGSS